MTAFAQASDVERAVAAFEAAPRAVVRTPGYRLAHTDQGDPAGHPVVIVHGLSDQGLSFALLTEELVRRGFRTVTIELAGTPGDGASLPGYRHSDHGRDIMALVDHLNLEHVSLLGASYGSTVALRTVLDYPARVRRVVLQGGFARRPLNRIEVLLAQVARFLPGRMRDLPGRTDAMAKLDGPQFAGAPPEVYRFMLRCSGDSAIRTVAQRALVLKTLDLRPRLHEIKTPVLLIGGEHDPVVPRDCERELERGLSDVRRVELPLGHYPQYVFPAATAAATADFLA